MLDNTSKTFPFQSQCFLIEPRTLKLQTPDLSWKFVERGVDILSIHKNFCRWFLCDSLLKIKHSKDYNKVQDFIY